MGKKFPFKMNKAMAQSKEGKKRQKEAMQRGLQISMVIIDEYNKVVAEKFQGDLYTEVARRVNHPLVDRNKVKWEVMPTIYGM